MLLHTNALIQSKIFLVTQFTKRTLDDMHKLSGAGNDVCHIHSQHKQKLNQYEFMKGNGVCDLHVVSAPLRSI